VKAAAVEASAAARRGMPTPEGESAAPPAAEPWRPRVRSDLPPLPAFGPNAEPPPE
jgi:hypothetical protein